MKTRSGCLRTAEVRTLGAPNFDTALLICIAGALIVVLARAMFMPRFVARGVPDANLSGRHRMSTVIVGAVLGLVLGVTSLGSGALVGLALTPFFRLTPHRVHRHRRLSRGDPALSIFVIRGEDGRVMIGVRGAAGGGLARTP